MDSLLPRTLPLAFLLIACGADFEPGSHVGSPRILALQADQPYARPGEHVALALLYANPEQEPLSWAFGMCTLPASSTVDGCLADLDGELTPFDPESDELAVDVPEDALDGTSAQQRPSALIGAVVVACPGQLAPGRTGPVPVRCLDDTGHALPIDDLEVGIKRVFLRARERNANPAIERVLWDGEPWADDDVPRAKLCPHDGWEIDDCDEALQQRITVQTSAQERGHDELGGEFSEQLIVQFYATHGSFRDQVRIAEQADNRWVAQRAEGDRSDRATLWFVARDDRGGVSWTTRQVELAP